MEFSIIIPVAPSRNAEVLESLNNVDYPKEKYEVIVEKGINPSLNRDNGINKSKYNTLIFLDDDAAVEKNFLKNIADFFTKYPEIDILGGVQLTPKDDTPFSKISGLALSSFFGAYRMKNRYFGKKINLNATEKDMTSAICIIKKTVFSKISDFNPKYFPGEDPDLFIRAKKNNLKLAYSPDIKIYHRRRASYNSFIKQIYFYGRVRPKISKHFISSVFIIPSLFVFYIVSLPILLYINKLFLIPLGLYLILAFFSSLYESIKNKNILAFFTLPFLYLTMHIAYGIGFISGLLSKEYN